MILLASALLLRALPRAAPAEGWSWRADLPLALASGGLAAWLAGFVTYASNFAGVPVDSSDHDQYCVVVRHLHDGVLRDAAGGQRSGVAAMLAGWLSHATGPYDALALAALISFGAMSAATYVWARAFGGRVAGVAAALACAGVELVATLPRNLTLYPEIDAATVLAAAGAAWALARGGLGSFAFAGAAVGLVLLVDVRGLVWALPCGAAALAGALVSGRRAAQVGLLSLGIAASWPLAYFAWHDQGQTIEAQTATWARVARPGAQVRPPPDVPHGGFRWGASSPLALPRTFDYLRHVATLDAPPRPDPAHDRTVARVRTRLLPAFVGAGAIALLALSRRPRAIAALVVTTMPFVAALVQAVSVFPQHRYVTTGLLALPLLGGLAVGQIAERGGEPDRRWEGVRVAIAAGLLIAATVGLFPSPLDPREPDRLRASDGGSLVEMARRIAQGRTVAWDEKCAAAVGAWERPFDVRVYGLDLAR